MARPRLFLARDRVRRLPPIVEPTKEVVCTSAPGYGETDALPGPVLVTPDEGLMVTDASPSAASPPSVTEPSDQVALAPSTGNLGPAIPECPMLDVPAPAGPISIPAPRVRSVLPAPSLATEEIPSPAVAAESKEVVAKADDAASSNPAKRSEQLERIAREADRHTRRGFELASRNAIFAARSQFIVALRLIAQGLDTEHTTRDHSIALAEGLAAVREAEDFLPRGTRLEANLDLAAIVRGHRTPVLKQHPPGSLTPMLALKAYFTFAQERLAAAMGNEVAGSMALHGLGKLHGAAARNPAVELTAAEPKAVAFFQAALLVHPNNLMAANDLGVLLARAGHWTGARKMLEHAVAANPQSISWRNLEKVYNHLGDTAKARHAQQMADAVAKQTARRDGTAGSDKVRWLSPAAFVATHVDSRVHPVPHTSQIPNSVSRVNRR